jgi:ABC-type transport system substrate-binding protein
MKQLIKPEFLLRIMWASIVLVMVSFVSMSGIKIIHAKELSPTWNWTKENPKPDWWKWGSEYEAGDPVRGGIFRLASPKYIGLMNPNHWPVNDWGSMPYMYELLLTQNGKFSPSVNWLAESWEYTGSNSALMKLKRGITFHDGTEFNAETLKYQHEWTKNKMNGAWSRAWILPIKSVTVVDKYTVKFEFKKQWAAFPGVMASVPGYMISAKALKADVALTKLAKLAKKKTNLEKKVAKLTDKFEKAKAKSKKAGKKAEKKLIKEGSKLAKLNKEIGKLEKDAAGSIPLDKHAIGTGRFMVDEARPGNYLKLKRNPNWWFGKSIGHPDMPYFDGIQINVIPDPTVRLANLRAGKIDSISVIRAQYNLLKRDPNVEVYKYISNHWFGLLFNHAKGPFQDIRVRKAVSHAIDRKALIAGTQFGLAAEASGMYPVVHWAHNPNLKQIKYDPELSRKLLAEAGHADGLTVKGTVLNLTENMTVAQATKNMLKKVGINWEYEVMDAAARDDKMKNLEYDVMQGGWTSVAEPDLMPTGLYHPTGNWNNGRSNNKKGIALIETARNELNFEKRQKLYFELEKIYYDNYEDVWLWNPMAVIVYRKNVMGFNLKHYLQGRAGFTVSHSLWFKYGHP